MKDNFKKYVAVQYSGIYNMLMNANDAMELAGLNKNDYWYVIEHYSELKEEYPEAFEEGKKIGEQMRSKIG